MTDARPPRRTGDTPGAAAVIRASLGVVRRDAGLLLVLVALLMVPFGAALVALALAAPDTPRARDGLLLVERVGLLLLVVPLVNAAIVRALAVRLDGGRPTVATVYASVLPLLPRLVGTMLLGAALGVLGAILILPALVMLVIVQLVPQVVVLDGLGGLPALARVLALVRRRPGHVVATMLLALLLALLAAAVIGVLVLGAVGDVSAHDSHALSSAVLVPQMLVVFPLLGAAQTLLYLELRGRA